MLRITCAEAASGLSIGESMRVIARGHADACLSGGAESKLDPMGMLRQQFAGRLARVGTAENAEGIVRPYATDARGSALGEGGGILVLEAMECALERGARPIAEVAGFGASQSSCPDTVGLVYSDDDRSVEHAIRGAMSSAGTAPEEIDAVVPLGTGIPGMDAADRRAIQAVFGNRAESLPVVTFVPNVGLCGAGSGALATSIAAECLRRQMLPARIGADGASTPGLDAGPVDAREADLRSVLVFSTSLGGQNIALVLKRWTKEETS